MANTRFLFVYGTLMSTATSRMGRGPRARLNTHSRVIGPAVVRGDLYNLGAYPGLVLGPHAEGAAIASRVTGEVRELIDPAAVLEWLDLYEGIRAETVDGAGTVRCDYRREIIEAELIGAAAVRTVPVWAYIYQGSLENARALPSGEWTS